MAAAEEVIFMDELIAQRRVVRRDVGGGHSGSNPPAIITDDSGMLSVLIQEDEWLKSIMNDGEELENNQMQRPKIQKVPRILREIESNKKCFDPLVVSIGPIHHGKPELESMEKLKKKMARDYVKDSEKPIENLYNKVLQVAENARNCYAEGSTEGFGDEAFARMMFLDGCFILQFIHCIVNNKRGAMKMKSHDTAFVQRDLFLLENQLPFLVLEELMRLRFKKAGNAENMINTFIKLTRAIPPQGVSFSKRIRNIIRECSWITTQSQREPTKKGIFEDQPVHLLELVRIQLVGVNFLKGASQSGDWYSYRSAKELKTVGIHFRPGKIRCFTDVKYESTLLSGVLTLPPITVDDSTKSRLLNLVAYETCPDAPDDFGVTSFTCFMDSLIDHAEDVRELRSNGILLNCLGSDQQVADLFNEIANDLVPNPEAYGHVKEQIERHHKNNLKIWIAEWLHIHFSSPWAILAFAAAILAIALSIMQTYYARFPPKNT